HGDLCNGLSVSASTLTMLYNTCPARAYAHHYSNPLCQPFPDTEATEFGTAAHCYLMEGEVEFGRRYVIRPRELNLTTKEGRLWKAAHAGQDWVTGEDYEAILGMQAALLGHSQARVALQYGQPEVTAAIRDAETGIWLKTRPDYLRIG